MYSPEAAHPSPLAIIKAAGQGTQGTWRFPRQCGLVIAIIDFKYGQLCF
jgi:hypothetical protein